MGDVVDVVEDKELPTQPTPTAPEPLPVTTVTHSCHACEESRRPRSHRPALRLGHSSPTHSAQRPLFLLNRHVFVLELVTLGNLAA